MDKKSLTTEGKHKCRKCKTDIIIEHSKDSVLYDFQICRKCVETIAPDVLSKSEDLLEVLVHENSVRFEEHSSEMVLHIGDLTLYNQGLLFLEYGSDRVDSSKFVSTVTFGGIGYLASESWEKVKMNLTMRSLLLRANEVRTKVHQFSTSKAYQYSLLPKSLFVPAWEIIGILLTRMKAVSESVAMLPIVIEDLNGKTRVLDFLINSNVLMDQLISWNSVIASKKEERVGRAMRLTNDLTLILGEKLHILPSHILQELNSIRNDEIQMNFLCKELVRSFGSPFSFSTWLSRWKRTRQILSLDDSNDIQLMLKKYTTKMSKKNPKELIIGAAVVSFFGAIFSIFSFLKRYVNANESSFGLKGLIEKNIFPHLYFVGIPLLLIGFMLLFIGLNWYKFINSRERGMSHP